MELPRLSHAELDRIRDTQIEKRDARIAELERAVLILRRLLTEAQKGQPEPSDIPAAAKSDMEDPELIDPRTLGDTLHFKKEVLQ